RQLEALNAESGMLRRAVEDLRAEVGSRRAAVSTAGAPDTWRTPPAPPQPAQPYHYSSPVKPDRRGSGKDMAAAENAT
ncbi:hypothetical protein NPN18_27030, partial [Vibrio parahaemolyticus]|nr:hypothetical protein [Vibrio parahaemolyticus]